MKFESKYDLDAMVEFTSPGEGLESKKIFGFIRKVKFEGDGKQVTYDIEETNSKNFQNNVKESEVVRAFRPTT